jgi:hypothetical protein
MPVRDPLPLRLPREITDQASAEGAAQAGAESPEAGGDDQPPAGAPRRRPGAKRR